MARQIMVSGGKGHQFLYGATIEVVETRLIDSVLLGIKNYQGMSLRVDASICDVDGLLFPLAVFWVVVGNKDASRRVVSTLFFEDEAGNPVNITDFDSARDIAKISLTEFLKDVFLDDDVLKIIQGKVVEAINSIIGEASEYYEN